MNQILDIGINNLEPLQIRQIETDTATYQLAYNQLRSFRPARMSKVKDVYLNTSFNPDGFHFDRPFLKKETFSEGEYDGRQVSLLYNKFPFVKYHALLVIDKTRRISQYLSRKYFDYVYHLQISVQQHIPDFVITYNSLGAGASVNHLHFQVFINTQELAIFSPNFSLNGGTKPYPAACCVFTETEDGWDYINKLQSDNIPYNLIFKDHKIYCMPRKPADKEFPEIDISTYGWSDLAGAFILNDKQVFKQISADRLIETIKAVTNDTVQCPHKSK
jgi:ATP adenylyltransferase/5',5'''-P-1,P-4-tetraphosphate phosphorylase II